MKFLHEENEKDFVEDLLAQLMVAMEEIINLEKENKELKKKALAGDQDQTREKVDLVKVHIQERDEDLAKLKKEFHQRKRKQHEEVISMTNQFDKAKKQEDTLSSQLEQRHKSLNKLEEGIGQYKVEVSSLKSQLQEARKLEQGAKKTMEALVIIEEQVDEAEKERNTMICQLKVKDEEIFKLKSNIKLLTAETCKAIRIKEEMESLAKENEEIFKMKSNIISLKLEENEAAHIKEETEKQLAKKNNECERMEEEIFFLRKKVEGMNKTLKSSQALDDMLSHQRCPFDKSGFGYAGESSNKNDNASNKIDVKKPERNGDAPNSSKGKEKNQGNNGRNPTSRINVDNVKDARRNGYHQRNSRQKDFSSTSTKSPSPRYQSLFLGHCYSCTNFGHMAKDCKTYHKDICYGPQPYHKDRYYGPQQSPRNNFARINHEFLFMNNVECFKCHNVGHMACDCNLTWALTQAKTMQKKKVIQVWRRKQIQSESLLNSPSNNTCC